MKQIYYVIQTLIHGKGSIPFKVISLALGLGMSILLFARVAYEQSYEGMVHIHHGRQRT